MSRISVGRIARAHGVRGAVQIATALEALPEQVFLSGEASFRRVASQRRVPGGILARLDGVSDRRTAESLVGHALLADRERLPPLGEGEYYVGDLLGLPVEDPDGAPIGRVTGVQEAGPQQLLMVETGRGEQPVPLVAALVTIDLPGRRVVVRAPEGLFEL